MNLRELNKNPQKSMEAMESHGNPKNSKNINKQGNKKGIKKEINREINRE